MAPSGAASGRYKIMVLDVMMPGMNGIDVLRKIRQTSSVPVVMPAARCEN